MSHSDPTFGLMLGFGGGLFSFFKGFKVFRECRIVEDTPQIPIRSIPMGLVNVHGKAAGDNLLTSPVSHAPCYLYKVVIEKWKEEDRHSGWSHYRTDLDGVKFYVEDSSGKVLVDGTAAELDLDQVCTHEVRSASSASFQPCAATDEELLRYVSQASFNGMASFIGRGLAALQGSHAPQNREALEAALKHPVTNAGVSPEMMNVVGAFIQKRLAAVGPTGDPRKDNARLAFMDALQHPVGSPEFMERARAAFDQFPHDAEMEQKFAAFTQHISPGSGASNDFMPVASGRFRFTEYCIIPGREYNITGSCVENPEAKDVSDRNLITKGMNEATYLISDKALCVEESGLRKKALWMVFGGAAVAVICLAFLLDKFGLF